MDQDQASLVTSLLIKTPSFHLNLQQKFHDLSLFELVRREGVLIDVNEQFVKVLCVLGLHEGQLLAALGLWLQQTRRCRRRPPDFLRLHEKADWGTSQWCRRCGQLTSRRPNRYITWATTQTINIQPNRAYICLMHANSSRKQKKAKLNPVYPRARLLYCHHSSERKMLY